MTKEKMVIVATAIANARKKWASEESALFLAAILKDEGIDKDSIDAICESVKWHNAVLNGSQFAQWADGKEGLGLDFKLRRPRAEKDSESMASMLDELGI
jgi:hypothetical protein